MKRRTNQSTYKPDDSVIDDALDSLKEDELRQIIRDLIPWLDHKNHSRLANDLIERATRNKTNWAPTGPSDEMVAEIVAFSKAAKRVSYADPSIVDEYLRQGSNAFLAKDYPKAYQIFRTLLFPIANADIDLGQHEMINEVLGVEPSDCASQYVVSVYMTTSPERRVKDVRRAIADMDGAGYFFEPLKKMESVAVEPLPDFDNFMVQWRDNIRATASEERRSDWDTNFDRWLREVTRRLEGVDGLADIARSTKRADDLRAWCGELVELREWKAALLAYEEAAEIVEDRAYSRGDFLDGAALAAQELGKQSLPTYLEHAWTKAPSLLRLRRWLGSSSSREVLKKRAAKALESCPEEAHTECALLHLLLGEWKPAAALLASAPGLGWSNAEHPGHLLVYLFYKLMAGVDRNPSLEAALENELRFEFDERLFNDSDRPRLDNPKVDAIVDLAEIKEVSDASDRAAIIRAMRTITDARVEGVVEQKRRRHYGHAAMLTAVCLAVDPSPETMTLLTRIRTDYRRYPALQRELDRYEV
jgi:hypothetical protein